MVWLQGPGRVPLANLDNRQGPEDPQASKEAALFFKGLTRQAALAGVAVDVLAVGQAAVNLPLLGSLTQRTGGVIMAHQRKLSASACAFLLRPVQSYRRSRAHVCAENVTMTLHGHFA